MTIGSWRWATVAARTSAMACLFVLGACQQVNAPPADAAPPPPDVAALAAAASSAVPAPAGAAGPAVTAVAVPGDAASAREAVIAAIGPAACDADAQCRTVGIGHRPCGGPDEWLAWSTAGDAAAIEAAAVRHRALRRAEVEARGLMGICAVLPDPGAVCRAGRCVTTPRP